MSAARITFSSNVCVCVYFCSEILSLHWVERQLECIALRRNWNSWVRLKIATWAFFPCVQWDRNAEERKRKSAKVRARAFARECIRLLVCSIINLYMQVIYGVFNRRNALPLCITVGTQTLNRCVSQAEPNRVVCVCVLLSFFHFIYFFQFVSSSSSFFLQPLYTHRTGLLSCYNIIVYK